MKPTSFKETNKVYGAGDNPNTDQLAVCIASREAENFTPTIISRWKIEPEELERINQTGEIWVTVMGVALPPISPTAWNPFDELGYTPLDI